MPIEPVATLDVDAPVEGLLELLADPSMDAAVLCGHGGQIAALLRLLGRADSGGRPRRQKGSTWVLDRDGGLRAVRYLPPLQRKRWPARSGPAPASDQLVHRAP